MFIFNIFEYCLINVLRLSIFEPIYHLLSNVILNTKIFLGMFFNNMKSSTGYSVNIRMTKVIKMVSCRFLIFALIKINFGLINFLTKINADFY